MQQSQTQESTGDCTPSGSPQSALPCITEYGINFAVKGKRCGHMKGVGRQLTRMSSQTGACSVAISSSTSVPSPTFAQPTAIPKFTRMIQSYHQYLQSYVSSVMSGFQLPLMSQILPMPLIMPLIIPPQQGPVPEQPDDEETDGDDGGPANLGANQGIFIFFIWFLFIRLLWF